jgi:hypothetical protein
MVFDSSALLVNNQPALDFDQVGQLRDPRVRFFGGITLDMEESGEPNRVVIFYLFFYRFIDFAH